MIKSVISVFGVGDLGGRVVAVVVIDIVVADTVLYKVGLGDVLHVGHKQVGVFLPVLVSLECGFLGEGNTYLHIGRAVEHMLAYLDVGRSEFLHSSSIINLHHEVEGEKVGTIGKCCVANGDVHVLVGLAFIHVLELHRLQC